MEKNEEKKKRNWFEFLKKKEFWIGIGVATVAGIAYGRNFDKVNSKVSAGGKYVAGKTKSLFSGLGKNNGATVNVETAPISPTETVETQEKVSVLFSSDGPKKQPMEYRNNNGGNYNNEYRPREYQNFKKN